MKAFHFITTNTTVDALASELWDLRDPATGSVTTERLERATTPLRMLNASLPSDGSTFGNGTVPFVILPWLPGLSLRPPVGMQADLSAIDLHTAEQVAALTPAFLSGVLLGGATVDPAKAVGACQLMGIPGIGGQLAEALYDDTTSADSLDSPSELLAADQANLKTLLQAITIGGTPLPAYYLSARPWDLLQRRAKRSTPAPRWRQTQMTRRPIMEAHAIAQMNRWGTVATSVQRSAAARTSAAHIQFAYRFAKHVSTASVASASGKHQHATQVVLQVYKDYGAMAVKYGLVAAGSDQATGPSLQTVLEVTRRLLDELDDDDCSVAASQAGLDQPALGFRSFTMAQLDIADEQQVTDALTNGGHRVSSIGRARLDTLSRLTTDTRAVDLPWPNLGIGTPNAASLVRDYTAPDRDQMYENARTASFTELTSPGGAPLWSILREQLPLRDVRALVGTSLDQGGVTPSATATFNPAALQDSGINSGLNPVLSDFVSPFDRWVEWTSHAGTVYRAPLNGSFEERYRQDVLTPLLSDSALTTGELQFPSEHFNDPAAILFIAPMMFARHLPHILSRGALAAGSSQVATAYLAAQPTSSQLAVGSFDISLVDMPQHGETQIEGLSCRPPQDLYPHLHDMLVEGETAYRQGEHHRATRVFNELIDLASRCPWIHSFELEANDAIEALPTVDVDPLVQHTLSNAWIVDAIPDTSRALLDFGQRLPPPRREDAVFRELYQIQTLNHMDTITRFASGVVSFEDDEDYEQAANNIAAWSNPAASGSFIGQQRSKYSYYIDYRVQIQTVVLQAALHLRKLDAGLNWLGFLPSYIPIWSFDYLVTQAQQFADRAEQLQGQALSYLTQSEDLSLQQTRQEGAAEIADLGVSVAELEQKMARQRAEQATLQHQAALDRIQRSEETKVWGVVASIGGTIAGVLGVLSPAKSLEDVTKLMAWSAAATGLSGAASTGANYQANQSAQKEAEDQARIAFQEKQTAETAHQIARASVDVARAQAALDQQILQQMKDRETSAENLFALHKMVSNIADSQLRMANIMAWLAQQALWFEARKIPDVIQPGYAGTDFPTTYSVASQLRTDIDALIQGRILARQNPDQLVKTTFSVLAENPVGLYAIRENGGVEIAITQKMLDLRYPGLFGHRLKRIEVEFIGLVPFNGINGILHRTGTAKVRVPYTRDYLPQLFGANVDIDATVLEVIEDWCYPSAGGAASTPGTWDYRTAARSTFDTLPPFALSKVILPQQVQVLSEYRRAQDGTILSVQPGLLDTLENSPPTGTWFIQLPAHANDGDLSDIADVRLTLHFSAEFDPGLSEQQAYILKNDSSATIGRSVQQTLGSTDVDALTQFRSPPRDRSRTDVRLAIFDFDASHFPAGLDARTFENFFIALLGLQGQALTITVKCSADDALCRFGRRQATHVVGSSPSSVAQRFPDGVVASNHGRTETYEYQSTPPLDFPALQGFQSSMDDIASAAQASSLGMTDVRWVVKVVEEVSNSAFRALDDNGDPDSETTGQLSLAGGGRATTDIGTWSHVRVQTTVSLGEGSLTITLRDGTASPITATLDFDSALNTLSATLAEGGGQTATLTDTSPTLDAWYVVRVEVDRDRARLYLDEILLCEIGDSVPLAAPAAGDVAFAFTGSSPAAVADVRVTKLRYDGTPLGVALDERFADTSAWTLAPGGGTATRVDAPHLFLDLSMVGDVMLCIDYDASIAP